MVLNDSFCVHVLKCESLSIPKECGYWTTEGKGEKVALEQRDDGGELGMQM